MRLAKVNLLHKNRKHGLQKGVALLISIFILMLVSVVAIAMILSSGTESALAGNYRASTGVYYAAMAGLEEARGRLLAGDPNAFNSTSPGFLPAPGTALAVGAAAYVLNPGPGEDPATLLTNYPDTEYSSEFGAAPSTVTTTNSMWNSPALITIPVPGPLYKWVRINAVSEESLKLPVDSDTTATSTSPLFYDGSNFTKVQANNPQVLEITALAALPNGSGKILQYLTAPSGSGYPGFPAGMNFPAGLTIAGNATYGAPRSNGSFFVSGVNPPSCSSGSSVHSIGVFSASNASTVQSSIPAGMQSQYKGVSAAPDVANVSALFPSVLQTPSQLDKLAQAVTQNADIVLNPPPSTPLPWTATQSLMPTTTSPTNPQTIVVNGNLDLTAWHHTGYGILLITGNFIYDPDVSWNGIILVIGQGTVTGDHGGSGVINGAMFVAKTRDGSGTLLPDPALGTASVVFDDEMGGVGIQYNNCWVQNVQTNTGGGSKILSFHEITQ